MDDLAAWLALHEIVVHRPQLGVELVARFDRPAHLLTAPRDHLGLSDAQWHSLEPLRACANLPRAQEILRRCRQEGIAILPLAHPAYPSRLREIPDPPLVLFVRGDVGVLERALAVAVVGTRKPSPYGREVTADLAGGLSDHDIVVVSGLAFGIDAAAHRAALQARQPTVAVLASGVEDITPRAHCGLGEEIIARGGALVSEYPPATTVRSRHYPQRNRIISGLCQATLIVEGAVASGTMWTARHCMEQGRLLFAVPGSVYHAQSAGPHHLIREGGIAVRNVGDVVDALAQAVGHKIIRRETPRAGQPFGPGAMGPDLLAWLTTPRTLSDIAAWRGESVAAVLAWLTTLEVEGRICRRPNGAYVNAAVERP